MNMQYRSNFADALLRYGRRASSNSEVAEKFLQFLDTDPQAFERSNLVGHFTGSSVVIDPWRGKILLTHHAKMLRWVQLGGHCDGIRDPFFVAWKEAYEEGGLKLILPESTEIFDLSVHVTPQFQNVLEHLHYDVRYLFHADSAEGFVKSDESLDLAWVDLGRVADYSTSKGMLRLEMKAIRHIELTHGFSRPSSYKEPALADPVMA